jgi:hypothetical protein
MWRCPADGACWIKCRQSPEGRRKWNSGARKLNTCHTTLNENLLSTKFYTPWLKTNKQTNKQTNKTKKTSKQTNKKRNKSEQSSVLQHIPIQTSKDLTESLYVKWRRDPSHEQSPTWESYAAVAWILDAFWLLYDLAREHENHTLSLLFLPVDLEMGNWESGSLSRL